MVTSKHEYIVCDPDKCTSCNMCELACAITHAKTFDPSQSRIRVVRIEPVVMMAVACRMCEDAPCVIACPRNALTQNPATGVIKVDNDLCDGCGWCIQACDFGAIHLNPATKDAEMCDLCADQEEPQCVAICPKEALKLSTPQRVAREARKEAVSQLLKELLE
ncbi:MAG: 4Fe-4S dicluster domain-containing protein [Chloroflexi bacterium]|mgnify:CR=1 FL=1|nr:4Fe-4S dicluster domain-containing protein [Chloroflexota bacterium]